MKKNFAVEILMLFLSWNKSKEDIETKKETKMRNQKKAKMKDKKEETKKRTSERQSKRNWKRGRPKEAKEKQRETLKNKQKMPFSREKNRFFRWETEKGKEKRKKKTQKQKQKKQREKRAFQLSVKFFFCFWWASKISLFLTAWPKKRAPKKHYKTRGFSKAFFEKQICVTKWPYLDKNSQIQKFQLSFLLPILFSFNKNINISWNPYFYSVLANLKKRIFKV